MRRLSIILACLLVTAASAADLAIGSRVVTTRETNVRSEPRIAADTLLGKQPAGSLGTIVQGPVEDIDTLGNPIDWWWIDFEDAVDGWAGSATYDLASPPPQPVDSDEPAPAPETGDDVAALIEIRARLEKVKLETAEVRRAAARAEYAADRALEAIGELIIPASPEAGEPTSAPGKIALSWHDNSSNEDGFHIERSADGGITWAELASVAANVTTYEDVTAEIGVRYCYRVRAYNKAGQSPPSNVDCVTPALP